MSRHKLSNGSLAALGAPALPMAALTLPLIIYLPEYCANGLGMNLAVVGLVFTVVRLADIFFDPILGGMMDRGRTRWGQFKPWLIIGAPLVMGGTYMLFMARPGVGAPYLCVGLVFTYVGYSIVILAQMGLGTNITADYRERSRVFAWWQIFNTLGLIMVMAMPVIFAQRVAHDASFAVRVMGWFVLASTPVTIGVAFAILREGAPHPGPRHPGLQNYFGLLRVRSVRQILLSQLLLGLGLGISAAVFLFFFIMIKQVPRQYVGLQFVGFYLVGICVTPLWMMLANRIGKHRALVIASFGFAFYMTLMLFMPPGNMVFFGCAALIGGTVACACDMLPRTLMADASDEDRLETTLDRTGLLFALLTMTLKFGQALSIGIVYCALDLIGFKASHAAANAHGAVLGLEVLYGVIPAILYVGAAMVLRRYQLTPTRHAEIIGALSRRDAYSEAELEYAHS